MSGIMEMIPSAKNTSIPISNENAILVLGEAIGDNSSFRVAMANEM